MLLENLKGQLPRKELFAYWGVQFSGAIAGVWVAHAMFGQEIFQLAARSRNEPGLWLSEFVATFGLICTIALAGKRQANAVPASVAVYIMAAYWFTASTSFANPAVTIARAFTNTFCGIALAGVLPFVFAQLCGALFAAWLLRASRGCPAEASP